MLCPSYDAGKPLIMFKTHCRQKYRFKNEELSGKKKIKSRQKYRFINEKLSGKKKIRYRQKYRFINEKLSCLNALSRP